MDLGRNAQGKRLRKYVNIKGKKADAEKRLREFLTAADKGLPIQNDKINYSRVVFQVDGRSGHSQ